MKTIKQNSLDHYARMIKWAEKQLQKDKVDFEKMFNDIEEDWYTGFCDYCKKYNSCKRCVLYKPITDDELYGFSECCGGLWHQMNMSETWGDWLFYAYKVRDYIEQYG